MSYALDTNIIIHILRQNLVVLTHRDSVIGAGDLLVIPPIVNFEIKRGFHYASAPAKERLYEQLCSYCPIGEMDSEAWELAAVMYADIRRDGYTISDADLLIAAFCASGDYTLVTGNTKHFEIIRNFRFVNWLE